MWSFFHSYYKAFLFYGDEKTQNPPPAGFHPMTLSRHDLIDAERRDQYLSGILDHASPYEYGLGRLNCPLQRAKLISIVC